MSVWPHRWIGEWLLPLALGLFGLSGFLTPIAVAIVWGLTFSTFLTLLLVPGLYAIVDDIAGRTGRTRFHAAAPTV